MKTIVNTVCRGEVSAQQPTNYLHTRTSRAAQLIVLFWQGSTTPDINGITVWNDKQFICFIHPFVRWLCVCVRVRACGCVTFNPLQYMCQSTENIARWTSRAEHPELEISASYPAPSNANYNHPSQPSLPVWSQYARFDDCAGNGMQRYPTKTTIITTRVGGLLTNKLDKTHRHTDIQRKAAMCQGVHPQGPTYALAALCSSQPNQPIEMDSWFG